MESKETQYSYRRYNWSLPFFVKNNSIKHGVFNAGFENLSILDIAKNISKN